MGCYRAFSLSASRHGTVFQPEPATEITRCRNARGVNTMRLGRYGQLHREQLQRSLPEVYRQLQREGKLAKHLQAVDQSADRMRALLLKQLAEKRPYNPVEWKNSREAWEGSLERIADELVLEDRVYVPMPDPDGEGP